MAFNLKLAKLIGLNAGEIAVLRRLSTPEKVQDFLTSLPSNPEPNGDTCFSVRMVLRNRCCHCIEAAFFAACALMLHGQAALLMDMEARGDDDHVVALFKRGKYWGAISKSNHIWLRWRDPIYRDLRELAMSYFHEYVRGSNKTLRTYSRPIAFDRFDPGLWVTNDRDCWEAAERLVAAQHFSLITAKQAKHLRKRDAFELYAGGLKEFGDDMKHISHG